MPYAGGRIRVRNDDTHLRVPDPSERDGRGRRVRPGNPHGADGLHGELEGHGDGSGLYARRGSCSTADSGFAGGRTLTANGAWVRYHATGAVIKGLARGWRPVGRASISGPGTRRTTPSLR